GVGGRTHEIQKIKTGYEIGYKMDKKITQPASVGLLANNCCLCVNFKSAPVNVRGFNEVISLHLGSIHPLCNY
ncbi:MAG: hypothetical protein ACKO2S_03285, partial [Burkholderiaceae bacterium]